MKNPKFLSERRVMTRTVLKSWYFSVMPAKSATFYPQPIMVNQMINLYKNIREQK